MTNNIVGIVGWIGCGKDTVADHFVDKYNFSRVSFASSLKDAVAAVFGWDREALEGLSDDARAWRERVDPWWSERLQIKNFTPRLALQLWGTEVCRKGFHDDIWIASLENKLRDSVDNVVISDCRFPNEIAAINRLGGKVIWVQRGEKPHWYTVARSAASGNPADTSTMKALGIHSSEWAWLNSNFDYIIKNDGTLEDLYNSIDELGISNRF